jgi:hypothetical protein
MAFTDQRASDNAEMFGVKNLQKLLSLSLVNACDVIPLWLVSSVKIMIKVHKKYYLEILKASDLPIRIIIGWAYSGETIPLTIFKVQD